MIFSLPTAVAWTFAAAAAWRVLTVVLEDGRMPL